MSTQNKGHRSRNLKHVKVRSSPWKADMILEVHQKSATLYVLYPQNRWLPFEIAGCFFDSVFKGCWNSQGPSHMILRAKPLPLSRVQVADFGLSRSLRRMMKMTGCLGV